MRRLKAPWPHHNGHHIHTSAPQAARSSRIFVKKKPKPVVPSSWTPYKVPNLLLDLDAFESKFVRPYDERDEEFEKKKWASNPRSDALMERLVEFKENIAKADVNFSRVVTSPHFQPWRITDLDVLTAAIKGGPSEIDSSSSQEDFLSMVVDKNAIPQSVCRDSKKLLEWLLHRQSNSTATSTWLTPKPDNFKASLTHQRTFQGVQRLVSAVIQTKAGLKLVGQCTDEIATACIPSLQWHLDKVHVMLPFLNNLQIRLQEANIDLGARLCGTALIASARAFQLQAIDKYLSIGLSKGYWGPNATAEASLYVATALSLLLRQLKYPTSSLASSSHGPNSPRARQDLFRLLTGRSSVAGAPPSFRATITESPNTTDIYFYYIHLLAELGAFRTIVAEWNDGFGQLDSPKGTNPSEPLNYCGWLGKPMLYSSALLRSSHALLALPRAEGLENSSHNSEQMMGLDDDYIGAQVHMSGLTASEHEVENLRKLPKGYKDSRTVSTSFSNRLQDVLARTKEQADFNQTMGDLQSLVAEEISRKTHALDHETSPIGGNDVEN